VVETLWSRLNGQTAKKRGRICLTSRERWVSYQKSGQKQQEGEQLEEGFRRRFRLWFQLAAQSSLLHSSLVYNSNPVSQMLCCL